MNRNLNVNIQPVSNNRYRLFFVFLLAGISILYFSFRSEEDPRLRITKKDVQVKLPKDFPKPVYRFRNNKPDPDVFVLGRTLFYDNLLSKDNSTSCGTCHQQFAAFAHIDHALSHGIYGKMGKRNVPALQNLIWNTSFMWDGSMASLEKQPINPIINPIEMDETMDHVVLKLRGDEHYRKLFQKAFHDSSITSGQILKALAQFTGLMISANSKFDRYMRNEVELTATEQQGLELFRSRCANCHREPLFTDNSIRNNGLKMDTTLNDSGRSILTGKPEDVGQFRVPSLRNVEVSYPYMHDGRFRTLKDVIRFYSDAGNFSNGADKSMQHIGRIDPKEQEALIAFLKTLTDPTFLRDRRFADPHLFQ